MRQRGFFLWLFGLLGVGPLIGLLIVASKARRKAYRPDLMWVEINESRLAEFIRLERRNGHT